jgi:hypothetical protein
MKHAEPRRVRTALRNILISFWRQRAGQDQRASTQGHLESAGSRAAIVQWGCRTGDVKQHEELKNHRAQESSRHPRLFSLRVSWVSGN